MLEGLVSSIHLPFNSPTSTCIFYEFILKTFNPMILIQPHLISDPNPELDPFSFSFSFSFFF